MKKSFVACILILMVFAVSQITYAARKEKEPLTFVWCVDTDTPTLDAHMHSEQISFQVCYQIFDPLFRYDNKGKHLPALATDSKVINDTTIEIYLRKGVKFHNGEPFDAEVAKYNIDRILNPEQKSPQFRFLYWIKSVEVVDEYTIRIYTKEPYPVWKDDLVAIVMMPKKYTTVKGDEYVADHPIGTGPYKFVSWTRGAEIVLAANEDYYRGAPEIKKVVFKVVPDESTRIASLLSGDVDVVEYVNPEYIDKLKANKNLQVISYPILRFGWLCFADAMKPGSPLHDKRVRQAMNYAVDKESIIKNIIYGLGTPCVAVNPLASGTNPNVKPYPHDLEKAKQLMKEAGYPNGFEITLNMTPVNQIKGEEVHQAVQDQLSKIGIKMNIVKWSGVGYMELVVTGKANPMYMLNWGMNYDAISILHPFFYSKGTYGNFWNSPETDRLITIANTTMDPEIRKNAMYKAQEIIREEAPWLFMFAFKNVDCVSAKFEWEGRPEGLPEVFNVKVKK